MEEINYVRKEIKAEGQGNYQQRWVYSVEEDSLVNVGLRLVQMSVINSSVTEFLTTRSLPGFEKNR